jgi:hypothetical protein
MSLKLRGFRFHFPDPEILSMGYAILELGASPEPRHLPFQLLGMPQIVRVEESDKLPRRGEQPRVSRRGGSLVALV